MCGFSESLLGQLLKFIKKINQNLICSVEHKFLEFCVLLLPLIDALNTSYGKIPYCLKDSLGLGC